MNWKAIIFGIFIIVLFGIMGKCDYEDKLESEKEWNQTKEWLQDNELHD